MKKTCTNHCAGCAHYRKLSEKSGSSPRACHYILDTGHMARNIYASTESECEEKLAQLIVQMKAEIAVLRAQAKAG